MTEGYLEHHGVKGMRWGVRKRQERVGDKAKSVRTALETTNRKYASASEKSKNPLASKMQRNALSYKSTVMQKEDPSPLVEFLAKVLPASRRAMDSQRCYRITDSSNGKKIGNMYVNLINGDEANLEWLNIKSSSEGKGHGTNAMKAMLSELKKQGFKRATLEVPTDSPNARHIYEKLGFSQSGDIIGDPDDIWGGLTPMQIDLRKYNG